MVASAENELFIGLRPFWTSPGTPALCLIPDLKNKTCPQLRDETKTYTHQVPNDVGMVARRKDRDFVSHLSRVVTL